MLTVKEALTAILQEVRPLWVTSRPLGDALGLVLAEKVISDIDSPPFDKALMDGFAVRSTDILDGKATLKLVEEVTAGQVPSKQIEAGETTQIMTGAPIPAGSDAVVRVEDSDIDPESRTVHVATSRPVTRGTNVMFRGASIERGQCVAAAGQWLRPQELGALAEFGKSEVVVHRRPRVAVLATGDELVPIAETPGPGQIRNSNETMLAAQIRRAGADPVPLGIARDNRDHLRKRIDAGLQSDMLLLSGGVSAGKLDLVPSELQTAGVRQVFHKVRVKPGQPVWFGVFDRPDNESAVGSWQSADTAAARCFVLGLPGNPVSSMVCFELFARPAIRRLLGIEPAEPRPLKARLTKAHLAHEERPTYHPAHLDWDDSGPVVCPVRWQGSADLWSTVEANAMALFPAGGKTHQPGEVIDVILWE